MGFSLRFSDRCSLSLGSITLGLRILLTRDTRGSLSPTYHPYNVKLSCTWPDTIVLVKNNGSNKEAAKAMDKPKKLHFLLH
ncbi:hypothetical protein J5N97_026752 [Dioscorea zingiberensis]|uniref:Uncharacterized protein n=1 Tax=Dioscorea zingiberensis TaxID=325984 RepID=A0A9D5H701_9LILI|nr:hypothetical protein J5N97_026752 [Dioscorea zingiberensis]